MSSNTRYKELSFHEWGRGNWRLVTTDDHATVGPHYKSKAELLADLDRYAAEYGCEGATDPYRETCRAIVAALDANNVAEARRLAARPLGIATN